jgi:small conductance mechanosensitive channel
MARAVIVIVVIIMVLDEVGVPVAPVLAGFGIAGVAVGFGAQYLIRDLIAGIFIIMENQYRVGDVVKVADTAGLVEYITLRKTVLRDLDGIVHHVPNGEIKTASNYTRHFSRVNLDIPVAYGTDLDHAIQVINRVGKALAEDGKWRKVIKSPPQVLRVNNLGDSGIDIKILGDVKPMEQWAVTGELRLRLKKAFDDEGIEIPWPHTKVYFGDPLPDFPKKKD